MKITFNKAAYCVKLPSLEEAGNVYKNYIDVFFILKKEKRITAVTKLNGRCKRSSWNMESLTKWL